jgi:hypothetical protein
MVAGTEDGAAAAAYPGRRQYATPPQQVTKTAAASSDNSAPMGPYRPLMRGVGDLLVGRNNVFRRLGVRHYPSSINAP